MGLRLSEEDLAALPEPTLNDYAERLRQLKGAIWEMRQEERELYRLALERGFDRPALKAGMKALSRARADSLNALMNLDV
jgi:uncharacterized protein (UPF0335 family)